MAASKKHYKGYSIDKRGASFRIRISFKGRTYTHTYTPPSGLTESKQYAAAEKEAIRLRDYTRQGYATTMPTFAEYANYVIESKKQMKSLRRTTLSQYKYLMRRLVDEFGDDLLDEITPQRLNKFYIALAESDVFTPASAIASSNALDNYLKKNAITYKTVHEKANVGLNTVSLAVHGKRVSAKTAEKICSALSLDTKNYFYIISNSHPISSTTVHEHISLLRAIFNTAKKERVIDFNPVEATSIPEMEKKAVNYYQPDEIIEIFDALSHEDLKWQVVTSLLIITGCRRGEIAGLRWQCILWEHNLLHINHEVLYDGDSGIYSENFTKTVDEKYVQLDNATMELLKQYREDFLQHMDDLCLAENKRPEYCFYQEKDPQKPMQPSSINAFLARFSERNGFKKINPHSLRHSLASALIADGVDDFAVAKQLGHKQVSTTREIYAHQINEHQAKVAARIPEIYNRK